MEANDRLRTKIKTRSGSGPGCRGAQIHLHHHSCLETVDAADDDTMEVDSSPASAGTNGAGGDGAETANPPAEAAVPKGPAGAPTSALLRAAASRAKAAQGASDLAMATLACYLESACALTSLLLLTLAP